MGTHPNAILMLVLTPDEGTRKTHRAIIADLGIEPDDTVNIGAKKKLFHQNVMESDYDEDNQLSAPEGSIVFWSLFTYGYGEVMAWDDLNTLKTELDAWAAPICEKHKCTPSVFVSANYW